MSADTWRLIREGDVQARYASRSECEMAIVVAGVRAQIPSETLLSLLLQPEHAGGESIRERANGRPRSLREIRRRFDREYSKAMRYVASEPPLADRPAFVSKLVHMRHIALERPWNGKAGWVDRSVLAFLYDLAIRFGSQEIFASVRDVAEGCGIGDATASRALRRLRNGSFVHLLRPGTPIKAASYRLEHVAAARSRAGVDMSPHETLRGDAWRYASGLGKACGSVWIALEADDWITVCDLAQRLGRSQRTIYKHLGQLLRYGLAERSGCAYRRGSVNPSDVATLLPSAGAADRQIARHERSRHHRDEYRRRRASGQLHGRQWNTGHAGSSDNECVPLTAVDPEHDIGVARGCLRARITASEVGFGSDSWLHCSRTWRGSGGPRPPPFLALVATS